MKYQRYAMLAALACLFAAISFAQQDMTKEQVQQEISRYTQMRNDQQAKLQQLTKEASDAQAQSSKLDGDVNKCTDELYALVGATAQSAAAYRSDLEQTEGKADELSRLSDADLSSRGGEVADLATKAKSLRDNKLSLLPDFSSRVDALDQKVASLQKALAAGKSTAEEYTVGHGDCLWKISQKSEVYNNGRLWPKLWVANKNIKNPDIIRPGQKLNVPAGTQLTPKEKAAMRKYVSQKTGGTP